MTAEKYFELCDQMGWEPKDEDIPPNISILTTEAQQAFILLQSLPDKWDGMSGTWLGKDYSGLSAIMDIYDIEDRRSVFELLQVAEQELASFYEQKRKEQEALAKAKRD